MRLPKYIVMKLDSEPRSTVVTITDISDRCTVIEHEPSNRITKERATPIRDYMVQQTESQTDCFFRNPTAEEMKSVRDYIDSISVPTGVNVFNLMNEL